MDVPHTQGHAGPVRAQVDQLMPRSESIRRADRRKVNVLYDEFYQEVDVYVDLLFHITDCLYDLLDMADQARKAQKQQAA